MVGNEQLRFIKFNVVFCISSKKATGSFITISTSMTFNARVILHSFRFCRLPFFTGSIDSPLLNLASHSFTTVKLDPAFATHISHDLLSGLALQK